jgi:hypothetical protein
MDLTAWWTAFKAWVTSMLDAVVSWFLGIMQNLAEWVVDGVLKALAGIIEAIPVPDFLSSAAAVFGGIPDGVVYLLGVAKFGTGLSIVAAAYLARFLIRRLPLVG